MVCSISGSKYRLVYSLLHQGNNRKKLAQSEPKLVSSLVSLMDSQSLKVQCQAALALRNLASDGEWEAARSLEPLLTQLFREIPTGNREG